ncbi:MAG: cob(I)yrinic acid a,c-diamide adenosyltransferase [FCB group bacterium]|nr:cob(I)yrinic acid a,c-diamide adenosyltransferase [FCB group bacterium]
MRKGTVQVYTGNGKGKTTAALGLCLRAAGRGMKSLIIQFMKGQKYGELDAVKSLGGLITIEQMGLDTFVHVSGPSEEDIAMAQKGLDRARQALKDDEVDILVLDEINVAVYFRLVKIEEVLELIDARPESMELVLTGRYAPPQVIGRADLVTRMECVKHYYDAGIPARDGIER